MDAATLAIQRRQDDQSDRLKTVERRDIERAREVVALSNDVSEMRTQLATVVVELRLMTEAWKAVRQAALYIVAGVILGAALVAFGLSGGAG
jgi:hypothetical protein